MEFRDLFELSSRATRYEGILREEQQRKSSSLGTYFQELDFDSELDIDMAHVVGKVPTVCETLQKMDKPINMPSNQPAKRNVSMTNRQYSFDLSKADALFDELLANKFLTLSPGHVIPKEKDRIGKEYCKWHNSFRHSTNNCVTFRNCVQDLIQKGLLKYTEREKKVMAVDGNPFPEVMEINMLTANSKSRGGNPRVLLSDLKKVHQETMEKGKKEDETTFVCFRCGTEREKAQAIVADKVKKNLRNFGLRFNTMGGNDLQIFNGTEMLYDAEDPGIFCPAASYGKDDHPFLFLGEPVNPCLEGPEHITALLKKKGKAKPHGGWMRQNEEPRPFFGHKQFYGPRIGPQGKHNHMQPRMVRPPIPPHNRWQGVVHPKFPDPNWKPMGSARTQKRKELRKFHAMMSKRERQGEEQRIQGNLVWLRGESNNNRQLQEAKKGPEKILLKQKMEEFKKILLSDEEEDEEMLEQAEEKTMGNVKEDAKSSSSGDFGEKLTAIQFGSMSSTAECNMIMALPKSFQAKPNQPDQLVGDVVDLTEPVAFIRGSKDEKIRTDKEIPESIQIVETSQGEQVVLQKPTDEMFRHLRPLYVKAHINGCPINKVLVDNGAVVNLLPSRMLQSIGKTQEDLIPTDMTVSNFAGGASATKGILVVQMQVGSRVKGTTFFVVDTTSNYNVLLGRDWIHVNGCVPSSLHQALIFLTPNKPGGEKMEIYWAEADPFRAETNNVEAILYKDTWGPLLIEKEELRSQGKGLTPEQFHEYLQEGFKQLNQGIARPGMVRKRPIDSMIVEISDGDDD